MKVLFSTTYYYPYVSGLTIYVKRAAVELARRGHDVTVLCMRHDKSLAESEIVEGVRVERAEPLFRLSKGFVSVDWVFKSWKEAGKADVVVVNLPQAEGWIPALLAKRSVAIYTCEIVLEDKVVQTILEVANRISLYFAKTIITYTKDYGENCRLLRGLEHKTKYIFPPVPKPTGRLAIKKPKGEIWIGVAARLAQEKGIEYLLEALPNVSGKLIVAGPMEPVGEEEYRNKIMMMVQKFHDRVVFLGTLLEMGGFYKLIDVLVLPSVNSTEAFGMVQVEAMLCGVPVVATDLPGVRVPVLKTGMGIIVPPRDSRALAIAINKILKNRNKYIKKEVNFDHEELFTEILGK